MGDYQRLLGRRVNPPEGLACRAGLRAFLRLVGLVMRRAGLFALIMVSFLL
jgi:hypothetical protein